MRVVCKILGHYLVKLVVMNFFCIKYLQKNIPHEVLYGLTLIFM